jgi:hypothetical protein
VRAQQENRIHTKGSSGTFAATVSSGRFGK